MNGQEVPSPAANAMTEQDIVPFVKGGENEIVLTWEAAGKEPLLIDGSVVLRILDPAGKELLSKEIELKGDSGTEKIHFQI